MIAEDLAVEYRPIDRLIPYARNARDHSEEQVAEIVASIKAFGFANPVLVGEDGVIIAGHGRVMAAKKAGMLKVPVIELRGLDETQRRQLILADNRIALNSGWNKDLLKLELTDLAALGANLQIMGFDEEELAHALAQKTEGLTDPDDAPEVPEVPVSRRGDLWICGRHRLLCGDSTDKAAVGRLLAGAKPHLMVTDPPYGVKYDPEWRKKAGLASDGLAKGVVLNDDRADWREVWALFPGQVAYVWHGALHNIAVSESLVSAGFEIRAQIVWVKTRAAISRGHYHWQHEPGFYAERSAEGADSLPAEVAAAVTLLREFGADGMHEAADLMEDLARGPEGFEVDHHAVAYVVRAGKTAQWRGGRKQTTTWFIDHIKNDTGHGTQKPVDCMRRPIVNNSIPGQSVYEPFTGSGTTMIAAEMEGRNAFCMELSEAYNDVIVKRWQAFVGADAVLEGDGRTFAEIAKERAADA